MKKKLLTSILGVTLAGATIFGAVGCANNSGTSIDVSQIIGEKGNDGVGIVSASLNNKGELVITLSDGSVINVGVVKGSDGATGSQGEKGDKGDTGAAGNGIASATINDQGELVLTYTDGNSINLGVIKGAQGGNVSQGEKGDTGATGNGIASATINDKGELVLTYTDGNSVNLGVVKGAQGNNGSQGEKGDKGDKGAVGNGIESVALNDKGELVVTFTNGDSANLGVIKGQDYERNDVTVTLIANGFTLEENEIVIKEGETVNLPVLAKEGYKFLGWYTEEGEKITSITSIVNDIELEAKFEKIQQDVTLYINGKKVVVKEGTLVNDLLPSEGYCYLVINNSGYLNSFSPLERINRTFDDVLL